MRVLFITNTFPPSYTGGAEVATYHTCRELIRREIACTILVINARSAEPVNEWYELGGLPVHRVNFQTRKRRAVTDIFDYRVYRAVYRELHRLKPDLVTMANVSGASLAPYVACRRVGVPVVNVVHDLWLLCPNNMLYRDNGTVCNPADGRGRCRQCYRRYDFWGDIPYRRSILSALTSNVRFFISPSQALIDRHVEAGYTPERFRLVRYALDTRPMEELRHHRLQYIVNTAAHYQNILFAGGGIEIKGSRVVCEALPMMLRHVERLRLIVVGGGEQQLLDPFRGYGLAVEVLGRLPFNEMQALYTCSDLALVPSLWHENSPMVIYQSYQAGVPVVGSAIGGIPELIREGETGYLVPAGDAAALTEKIILHFARPAHRRRHMREQCLREARLNLTLQQHVEGMLQVYQEALAR